MNKQDLYQKIREVQFIQPDEYSWNLNNEIHIWRFPAVSAGYSFLSSEEKMVAGRFRLEGDRNRFVIGRQALRIIVSRYLSVKLMDISVVAEPGTKPQISCPATGIYFNISHSGEWVIIALSLDETGVDVEKINPEFDFFNLLEDHFKEAEQFFINDSADPVSAFYLLWTRKEALMKAWGTGLQDHMKQFSVLNPDSSIDCEGKSWIIISFYISPGYPAAMAYSDKTKNLRFFDGSSTFTNFMAFEK